MRRLFSIVACLLAVLWLPATLHCGLETAGLWHHSHDEETTNVNCATVCGAEACAMVEEGAYKNPTELLKVPTPLFVLCVMHHAIPSVDVRFVETPSPEQTESPPELTRTWQFVARAALPPRAPSIA